MENVMKKKNFPSKPGAAIIALLFLVLAASGLSAQVVQTPLAGSKIPQFVDPLPNLYTFAAGTSQVVLSMNEFQSQVLSTGTFAPGVAPLTWVWSYQVPGQPVTPGTSYIGPVIVATRGTPTEMKFINNLGTADPTGLTGTKILAYTQSTDQTLHWADPANGQMNMGAHAMAPGVLPLTPWNLHYKGPIAATPHLHGGVVPPVLDGGPDSWFTSDGLAHGNAFYTKDGSKSNYCIYRYPNQQEGALIWFHDHTLGATRLNVYAGLAGAYLLTDPANDPTNLPPMVPLVIQDRMFDTNGQLFFPAGVPYIPNPEHPYWVPEFVGDTIVVNGKTWPYMNVEPKRYTFLIINGSNARTYELFLPGASGGAGPAIYQIGTDGGWLDKPAPVSKLIMMPGERAEIIIDFTGLNPGTSLVMKNTGRTPYPSGRPPQGTTIGQIMQFRVVALTKPDTSYNPATLAPLRKTPMVRLTNAATGALAPGVIVNKTRQLTLNEVHDPPITVNGIAYPGGPRIILVNNTMWEGEFLSAPGVLTPRADFTPVTLNGITNYISEMPNEGDTEIWEIVNMTADAHPIHLHLTQFQILNRQNYDTNNYPKAYAAAFPTKIYTPYFGPPLDYNTGNARALGGNPDVVPYLQGGIQPPAANEAGWKDTVYAPPGVVTRLAVRWAPMDVPVNAPTAQLAYIFDPLMGPGGQKYGYVWHCHIIDHEDNEMMRPDLINPKAGILRTYNLGLDY